MIRIIEKVLLIVTVILVLVALLLMAPFNKIFLSMTVMHFYSDSCEKDALTATEGIELNIPGGDATSERDWFPFVMTFHPGSSFGEYVGTYTSLSILYNFGDFVPMKGCSLLYDPDSPYYSSFYGAYLVKNRNGTPYGFTYNDDRKTTGIEEEEIAAVARFDYQQLVLRDFGLSYADAVFDFEVSELSENISYAGIDGWYKIDAGLTVNGCGHEKTQFTQSYLQYGIPAFDVDENLKPVQMYGRIYGKFIEEKGVSVFFYIITADKTALEQTDAEILSKSTLSLKR